jgi:hypothetical protein
VYGVPVAANKVLPSLLQAGGSVEISRSLTSAQREAALAVLLHRYVVITEVPFVSQHLRGVLTRDYFHFQGYRV